MKFSGLKESNQAVKEGTLDRIENKQRINLSDHAYSTLLYDLDIFQRMSEKRRDPIASLINHIFENYRDQAESSIALAMQTKRIHLSKLLSNMHDQMGKEEAIGLILKEYATLLEQKRVRRCAEKGHSLVIRIFTDNIEYLLSGEGQREGTAYDDKVGLYIKAVLEEYCELPYVERERIYYRKEKDEIDLAIHNQNLLRVVTRKRNTSYVKPLELGQDSERMYNYLVGLLATTEEGPWKIGSIRLSSITGCKQQSQSAFLSAETEKEIRKAMKENGIQYLSGSDFFQRVVVEFTTEGEKMYQQILHLRPQYTSREKLIYEFHCSVQQADNYFFKFGHNVRILEPIWLAEKFQRKYRNAAKKYE